MLASEWKAFYRGEREGIDLQALLGAAPLIDLPERGAVIFPHTRLRTSGALVAAAAEAVVRSGRKEVLALGVLHGGRAKDAPRVGAARGGDAAAIAELRGIQKEDGLAAEEFSLDNFRALVEAAAKRARVAPPVVHRRYPFFTGEMPETLPGIAELREMVERGAALVATTDPIHHGEAYGTPESERLDLADPGTLEQAEASFGRSLELLSCGDYLGFLRQAEKERSDFRDVGPVVGTLLGTDLAWRIEDLKLVDYTDVIGRPGWVAGGLAVMERRAGLTF